MHRPHVQTEKQPGFPDRLVLTFANGAQQTITAPPALNREKFNRAIGDTMLSSNAPSRQSVAVTVSAFDMWMAEL